MIFVVPVRTASMAGFASGGIRIHHCFITSGSSTVSQRSCTPTACVIGSCRTRRPFAFRRSIIAVRAVSRSSPASGPAAAVMSPRVSMADRT